MITSKQKTVAGILVLSAALIAAFVYAIIYASAQIKNDHASILDGYSYGPMSVTGLLGPEIEYTGQCGTRACVLDGPLNVTVPSNITVCYSSATVGSSMIVFVTCPMSAAPGTTIQGICIIAIGTSLLLMFLVVFGFMIWRMDSVAELRPSGSQTSGILL